jgi:hypothetical protein
MGVLFQVFGPPLAQSAAAFTVYDIDPRQARQHGAIEELLDLRDRLVTVEASQIDLTLYFR